MAALVATSQKHRQDALAAAQSEREAKYFRSFSHIHKGCMEFLQRGPDDTSDIPDFGDEDLSDVLPPTHVDDSGFFDDKKRIDARRRAWNKLLMQRGGMSAVEVTEREHLFHSILKDMDWMGADDSFKTRPGYTVTLTLDECTVLEAFIQIELRGRYEWVRARNLFVFVAAAVYGKFAVSALVWVYQMFHVRREDENGDDKETWLNTQGGNRWTDEDWDMGDEDLGTHTGEAGSAESQIQTACILSRHAWPWTDGTIDAVFASVGEDYINYEFHTVAQDIQSSIDRLTRADDQRAAAAKEQLQQAQTQNELCAKNASAWKLMAASTSV